jgi:hypothetical protein
VNSSGAFRWFIAGVLLLAIGWKIAIQPDDPNYLTKDLTKFLERNHFNVVVTDEAVNYTPIIRATAPTCHLQIARLTPDGSNRDLIRHLAAGTDRTFIVFRGTVYDQQPVFWTTLNYLWSRFLRELGLIEHITPVISVAVNSSCNAERLPWGELQAYREDLSLNIKGETRLMAARGRLLTRLGWSCARAWSIPILWRSRFT